VTLDVLDHFKGAIGPVVSIKLPGGEAGGVTQVVPGAPVLRTGEHVIVFVSPRGPNIASPVGLGQGIFRVWRDPASGTMLVNPAPLKSSITGRLIRGASDRRSLTLEAFAAQVRAADLR
jgi:hypothetical protein